MKFTTEHIASIYETLTATNSDLKKYFTGYISNEEYGSTERLDYVDIAEISRFIVSKFQSRETNFFKSSFSEVEKVLANCDSYIDNLIVVGLFEGIQNIGGSTIDYHFGFAEWLLPVSKTKWDNLIDSWEGPNWRIRSNS